jgi:glycosyltransferase involved in cell wall biosynthesis
MIKIASIVLNNFTNDSRVLKEGISLKNEGYDVTIVALHKEGLEEFEEVQNISVHRVKLRTMNWSKNIVASVAKYIEWSYHVIKKYRKYEVMHCHDLNALHIGVLSKLFNRKLKVIYDAHEYETEVNYLVGIKKSLSRVTEKFLIKYADAVITVSDAIAEEYVRLYNIPKPHLVLNTPPYKEIEKKDIFRETFNISEHKSIFLYQGNLSRGRGVEVVLETFKNLKDEKSVVIFMGYGELEEDIKVHQKKHNNIYFHEAVSPDILLNYTSSADFGISMIEDVCLSYRYCLPNKMFEYIMAGVPVIVSNLPEMKKLIEEYEVGVVAKENRQEALEEAIIEASAIEASALNKSHLEIQLNRVKSLFNWEEQESVLISLYRGVLNG